MPLPCIHPRNRDHNRACRFRRARARSERLPSCRDRPGIPIVVPRDVFGGKVSQGDAHRSRFGPAVCVRQHATAHSSASSGAADSPYGSPISPSARCVGPTSAISRLRTSTRASWVSNGLRPAVGESPASRQDESLRRASRMHASRASDTPVASPTSVALARSGSRSRQERRHNARVNRCAANDDPRCLPPNKDPRPAMLSRASGSGLVRQRG